MSWKVSCEKALWLAFLLAVSPAHAVELRGPGDMPANGSQLSGERGADILGWVDFGLRLGVWQSLGLIASAGASVAIADQGTTWGGPLVSLGAQWQL